MKNTSRYILTIAGTGAAVIAIGIGANLIVSDSASASQPVGQPVNISDAEATPSVDRSSDATDGSGTTTDGSRSRGDRPETVAPEVRDLDRDGDGQGDRDDDGDRDVRGYGEGATVDDDGVVHLQQRDNHGKADKESTDSSTTGDAESASGDDSGSE